MFPCLGAQLRPSRADRQRQDKKDTRENGHHVAKEDRRPQKEDRKGERDHRAERERKHDKENLRPAAKSPVKVDSKTVMKKKEQMNEFSQTNLKKGVADSAPEAPVSRVWSKHSFQMLFSVYSVIHVCLI